jgi:hypothetical protein
LKIFFLGGIKRTNLQNQIKSESIMSNKDKSMNKPWIRGCAVNPNVAIFADFIGFSRRPDLAALKYKIVAPVKPVSANKLPRLPSLSGHKVPTKEFNDFLRLSSPKISKPRFTDEELRQIKADEEYDRRQEDYDMDNFWREIEETEEREEKKMYAKNLDRSLEELRQQLTFNVDVSGEIHLVKRDPNNNNLHITRVSKART